jgi:hypothetical protein
MNKLLYRFDGGQWTEKDVKGARENIEESKDNKDKTYCSVTYCYLGGTITFAKGMVISKLAVAFEQFLDKQERMEKLDAI